MSDRIKSMARSWEFRNIRELSSWRQRFSIASLTTLVKAVWAKYPREVALLAGLPVLAMFVALIMNFLGKDIYPAQAKLLVHYGREYTYRPIIGDGSNLSPWKHEVAINAELEILNGDTLKRSVIERLGTGVFLGGGPDDEPQGLVQSIKEVIKSFLRGIRLMKPRSSDNERALRKLRANFSVKGVKDSNVVHLSYKHPQRDGAVLVLKTLLDTYMDQRAVLFAPPSGVLLEKALADRERDAQAAQSVLEAYKKLHGIAVIDSELRNAFEQELQVRQQILQNQVALTQAKGKESSDDPLSAPSSAALSELRSTINGLTRARAELEEKLANVQKSIHDLERHKAEIESLELELKSARQQLQSVRNKMVELQLEKSLTDTRWSNVRLIEAPNAPEVPPGLSPILKIFIAGFLGLIAAAGLLFAQAMIKAQDIVSEKIGEQS